MLLLNLLHARAQGLLQQLLVNAKEVLWLGSNPHPATYAVAGGNRTSAFLTTVIYTHGTFEVTLNSKPDMATMQRSAMATTSSCSMSRCAPIRPALPSRRCSMSVRSSSKQVEIAVQVRFHHDCRKRGRQGQPARQQTCLNVDLLRFQHQLQ